MVMNGRRCEENIFEAPNQTLHRSEENHENLNQEMQPEEGFQNTSIYL
jgi:hypothetical protein